MSAPADRLIRLARGHRWLSWTMVTWVGTVVALLIVEAAAPLLGARVYRMVTISLVGVGVSLPLVGLGLASVAMQRMPMSIESWWWCALIPVLGLLPVMILRVEIGNRLRQAGCRVGTLGARADDFERLLKPDLCKGCGYNLTGNVSGVCPECGRALVRGSV